MSYQSVPPDRKCAFDSVVSSSIHCMPLLLQNESLLRQNEFAIRVSSHYARVMKKGLNMTNEHIVSAI